MRQLTITQSITSRESLSLEKYLQEISKVTLISADEETRLSKAIKSGDARAFDALTKANLRFVVSVAKKYQFRGLSLSDLINEGNMGLMKAAKRFDETKGFKFISYAVWWIRQSMMQALSEQARLVRLPSNRIGMSNRVHRAFSQLEQEHERAPSAEEMAEMLHMNVTEVLSVSDNSFHHVSLDHPLSDTNDSSLLDRLIDSDAVRTDNNVDHTQSLEIEIMRCLDTLNNKQKEILCSFFGIGMPAAKSLQEIALKYDMTPERIRQIKEKAIKQLRDSKKINLLRAYLGK